MIISKMIIWNYFGSGEPNPDHLMQVYTFFTILIFRAASISEWWSIAHTKTTMSKVGLLITVLNAYI